MFGSTRRLRFVVTMAVALVALLVVVGCGEGAERRSGDQMRALGRAILAYADANEDRWPDRIEDIIPYLDGGQSAFDRLMNNPVTGEAPGYEYARPRRPTLRLTEGTQTVVLYQLRDGLRDLELPVLLGDMAVERVEHPAGQAALRVESLEDQGTHVRARLRLTNRSTKPLRSVHVEFFGAPILTREVEVLGFPPLRPGQSRTVEVNVEQTRGGPSGTGYVWLSVTRVELAE
ncbi:MAG: hypothetical protein JJU36_14830 [Phycisphaeraceae bacterium]|nr:hypothetical protein [Phycisphaeraceae bacterium]